MSGFQGDPDLITIPAAAARLGITKRTAYEWARAGKLPGALKLGSVWRVSLPRLNRFLHGEPLEVGAR